MKPDGIEIIFNLTNEGKFEVSINFHEQNEEAYQLFALFLSSLEKEQTIIYNAVIKKLKEMLKNDEDLVDTISIIFQHKSIIDKNIDTPVMRPSHVFSALKK